MGYFEYVMKGPDWLFAMYFCKINLTGVRYIGTSDHKIAVDALWEFFKSLLNCRKDFMKY